MAIDMHLKLRQQHYEHGERVGKMLSHQQRQIATAGHTLLKKIKGTLFYQSMA